MKPIIVSSYWYGNNIFTAEQDLEKGYSLAVIRDKLKVLGYELLPENFCDPYKAHRILFLDVIPHEGAVNFDFFITCINKGLINKMRLQLIESPIVTPHSWNSEQHQYFGKIYTWNDDLIDNIKYFKTTYFQPLLKTPANIPFNQRKLCTLISSNKMYYSPIELYSERIEAIRAFERLCPYQFDLYGVGWNQPRPGMEEYYPYMTKFYPSYRGAVQSKLSTLSKYKFCFCYENMMGVPGFSGYITEKIFHCLMAGCVPIYLGAQNIAEYIPDSVFIDRRKFYSYEKLYFFLCSISELEFTEYLSNISNYLHSQLFHKHFSVDSYLELLCKDFADEI